MPNEADFVGEWSRLHWALKPASFFYGFYAMCGLTILVCGLTILVCGLTILVDHFKLYLYYELTLLLLIYKSRWLIWWFNLNSRKISIELFFPDFVTQKTCIL